MLPELAFVIWSTTAVLNVMMALVMLCVLVSGESAYRYVGVGNWLHDSAVMGSKLPSLLVTSLMAMFLLFAAYCLSAIGVLHLPSAIPVLIITTAFYLSRVFVLIVDRLAPQPLPTFVMMSAYGSLFIGGLQALGLFIVLAG